MNQATLELLIRKQATQSRGENGFVEFIFDNLTMYAISDAKHDRMRIITPITDYQDMAREQIDAVMESNFHHALDARYAVSNGVLFAAFIHPLSSLVGAQLESALSQVANLANTFGSDYTSGVLAYGGNHD